MKTTLKHWLHLAWKPAAAVAGLLVLIIWTTGAGRERVAPGVVAHQPGFALPDGAAVVVVETTSQPGRVDVVGTANSDNAVRLHARVNAAVAEVRVSAGDRVQRDQELIRLDDRDIRAQLEAAQAGLRRAQAEYERIKRLHDTQAATEQQLIAAESGFQSARAQVAHAEVMLTFTVIRSPINGQVTDRHVEVGALALPGQPLVNVYDPSVMRLDAPVPVRLVDYVPIGTRVDVELERPDRVVEGVVHRVVSEIDPRSRTQTVQIMLDIGDTPILPGTFGRLTVPASPREVVLLPATAVYRVGQLEMVQVVENGRVIRRLVKTGTTDGDRIEILSGLTDGESVLVHPVLK